ncbi:hypothetical protein JB92DRAFT_3127877 [Gautieria morchelliformis]|nr:hypothetical protein JB92DRAFT_3127877 [Gautieria morchelliformis]
MMYLHFAGICKRFTRPRPGPEPSQAKWPGSGFRKPKPARARPKPRLSGQARPCPSLCIYQPGLIDEGETPEQTAFRELEEETGFEVDSVIETSPLMVSSPGMTSANMKLVSLRVPVDNADAFENLPKQHLESGEFIVRRVIRLDRLHRELQGAVHHFVLTTIVHKTLSPPAYADKGFVVDAKLSHFALGYDLSSRLARGDIL